MQHQAWQVITWQTIRVTLDQWREVPARLRHTSTTFQVGQHTSRATSLGQVLWEADWENRKVGVAWDWAEIASRYVVLLDPMSFVCNVSLVDSRGMTLDEDEKLVVVNDCIHSLPWQEKLLEARRHLKAVEAC